MSLLAVGMSSCVDEIKFGDSFLEKAPGVDITQDTIFGKAEYAREFLWSAYGKTYFGLPIYWSSYNNTMNTGVFECLSDCYQDHRDWTGVRRLYYPGVYNASSETGSDTRFGYNKEWCWECIRQCWIFIENVDRVPDMDGTEKERLAAEAKVLIAQRYFDLFRHFGGLPLVDHAFEAENSYEVPRATVEATVKFMTDLCDQAARVLPWSVEADGETNWAGRLTKAAAEGLKCKILLYAASPLFNSSQPYCTDQPQQAVEDLSVWYGGYKAELWTELRDACRTFFTDLSTNGFYELVQADDATSDGYRKAFFKAYFNPDGNRELLISNRRRTNGAGGKINSWEGWTYIFYRSDYAPDAYTPTLEFMEMFPNADGTPFNLDQAIAQNKVFFDLNEGGDTPYDYPTRDPRLYETMLVNGARYSGRPAELWDGGRDNVNDTRLESGQTATGFRLYKFYNTGISSVSSIQMQWPYLRLAEMYLIYAEALIKTGDLPGAITQIDKVRARVGLGGLAECNPGKNLTSDADALFEELLRERACELGFEDTRFFDMVRNKRKADFEKQLHGLLISRADGKTGSYSDQPAATRGDYPTQYSYTVFNLSKPTRTWWSGFDSKWYLSAFPTAEVNKGYGLTQNPGW